jgi:hypothetical protein
MKLSIYTASVLALAFATVTTSVAGQEVFINEIHYDNV